MVPVGTVGLKDPAESVTDSLQPRVQKAKQLLNTLWQQRQSSGWPVSAAGWLEGRARRDELKTRKEGEDISERCIRWEHS